MKNLDIVSLNNDIAKKKPAVERQLLKTKSRQRPIRKRERDEDEIKILDRLCILRWRKAEENGKIKYLSERKWFYDVN